MLEGKEEVVEVVQQAMRDLNLDYRGSSIEFHPLLPDAVGRTEDTHGPVVWEEPPDWRIRVTYPSGNENAFARVFDVNTSNFDNLEQIRRFIADQIRL